MLSRNFRSEKAFTRVWPFALGGSLGVWLGFESLCWQAGWQDGLVPMQVEGRTGRTLLLLQKGWEMDWAAKSLQNT
jgi:hypothetical protein